MKRWILTALFAVATDGALSAQNYIIIDSEKVFKSIEAYNAAIEQLDDLAQQYQRQVDAKFEEVESLYNTYMAQKASLSAAMRQSRENTILTREKEANEYQESLFGTEGTLMKKRLELIQPIQKRVFDTIAAYAARVGADMVLDSANNASLLYKSAKADHTQQVIDALK